MHIYIFTYHSDDKSTSKNNKLNIISWGQVINMLHDTQKCKISYKNKEK